MLQRDMLCIFESQDGTPTAAFQQALALARAPGALLTAVSVARMIAPPGSPFSASIVAGALHTANEKAREMARAAAKVAEDAARIAGVTCDCSVREDTLSGTAAWIGARARLADFTIVDRPSSMIDSRQAFFEDALFASGRPVLVASPDKIVESVRTIALAWDGSRLAARALGDALAQFPAARKAVVIVVSGEKELAKAVPGADVARHLARRGLQADVVDVVASTSAADAIDQTARASGADMIVMGGFGHSRLREFILGGVTRTLSETSGLPLFLAH